MHAHSQFDFSHASSSFSVIVEDEKQNLDDFDEKEKVSLKAMMKTTRSLNEKRLSKTIELHDSEALSPSRSTALTKGVFVSSIMKNLERENSLDDKLISFSKMNIGRGGDALVHKAKYKQYEIALKVYKFQKRQFNDTTLSKFESELRILKLLQYDKIEFHLIWTR